MEREGHKKRCLIVTPKLPYPPNDGGNIRMFNMIKRLHASYDLDLASFTICKYSREDMDCLKTFFKNIYTLDFKSPFGKILWMTLKSFVSKRPVIYARYYQKEMIQLLARMSSKENYDLALFSNMHMAQYCYLFPRAFKMLDAHNNDIRIMRRWADTQPNIIKRLIGYNQTICIEKFYKRMLPFLNAIITVSEGEKGEFEKLCPGSNLIVCRNGVDLDHYKTDSPEKDGSLLYTGDMSWWPNTDACHYFIREIFPLIKEKKPDARLVLAGREPPFSLLTLRSRNIEITGYVEDIRPYFEKAGVFVVPLRAGGGTRLKILEAMAMKVPVVSTSVGCEGLEVENGRHLLIRDNPRDFAESVVKITADDAFSRDLASNAFTLVKTAYNWESILEDMIQQIERKYNNFITLS
jgi:glycosyltransferase involved in cell wall biosynthesis